MKAKTPFQSGGFVEYTKEPAYSSFGVPGRITGAHEQWLYLFPNDYGASVITGTGAYGTAAAPYELGVLHGADTDAPLCYSTPVTSDVVGFLTVEAVNETLAQIAALPPLATCDHGAPE